MEPQAETLDSQADAPLVSWGLRGRRCIILRSVPGKLWWFSHGIEQEHSGGASGTSAAQENVSLGTLLHEESYKAVGRKDVLIDNLIRLDLHGGWRGA